MKRVLVIEDDTTLAHLLEIHLKDLTCEAIKVTHGQEGLALAEKEHFDLIVLDLMLPDMDGMDVCRQLRMAKSTIPILILTAKSEEIDKILGLESGADDYITKPFSVREFIARVKAIFRRIEMLSDEQISCDTKQLHFDNLQIDVEKRIVRRQEERIELTPKEFDLLVLLASNPGRSYTREKLLNLVWGYQFEGYEHTVNSHINRLRSKIEPDLSQPKYILTTWGVGYRFSDKI